MAAPATKRQRQYAVAKNTWQDIPPNTLTNVNAPAVEGPPPNLNGVLWKEDYESPGRLAHSSRRLNWLRAGDSQQQANQEGLLQGVLSGQDTFYGDPGQAITFGVTERRRDLWRERLLQHHITPPVEPVLTGQNAFYGAPGEAPIFAISQPVLVRRPLTQDFTSVNIQALVLTPPAEAVPPGLGSVLQLFDFDPAVRSGFSKALRYRGHPADPWAMLLLAGQDVFYGDPGQAPTFNLAQPYPRKLWVPPALDPVNTLGTVLAEAGLPSGLVLDLAQPYPRRLFLPNVSDFLNNQGTVLAAVVEALPSGLFIELSQPYPRKLSLTGVYYLYVNRSGLLVAVAAGPTVGSIMLVGVGR